MSEKKMPTYLELMPGVIKLLREMGGSCNVTELKNKLLALDEYSEEWLEKPYNQKFINAEQLNYRSRWALTYLKVGSLVENSKLGVWTLTKKGREVDMSPENWQVILKDVTKIRSEKAKLRKQENKNSVEGFIENKKEAETWQEQLKEILYSLSPQAFERLTQQVLLEAGFSKVVVTGKAGDGGIDGTGIAKVNGIISFPIAFQSKRYKGSVGPEAIRGFRGAMHGRADRGLFISTGRFTKSAMEEADREGTFPVELMDGDELIEKLKELQLGVKIEMVEEVSVDADWFSDV